MLDHPHPLNLIQTVPPTVEPVVLADAKAHMRVDNTDEDAFITSLISVAREYAETETQRQFITATWQLRLDQFPHRRTDTINLPRPLLQSITSIIYTDTDGVPQTLAPTAFQVDTNSVPGRIRPAYGTIWPYLSEHLLSPIVITYQAGYGPTAASVPAGIIQAIKIIVADMFEHRESLATGRGEQPYPVPFAASALLGPFRQMSVY